MARTVRVEFPGAFYHVMARGDRREAIGRDDADRATFVRTLAEASEPEFPEDKKGRFVYGLAVFSDDGVNVTVQGSLIHQRFGQGQHLPSIGESFHPPEPTRQLVAERQRQAEREALLSDLDRPEGVVGRRQHARRRRDPQHPASDGAADLAAPGDRRGGWRADRGTVEPRLGGELEPAPRGRRRRRWGRRGRRRRALGRAGGLRASAMKTAATRARSVQSRPTSTKEPVCPAASTTNRSPRSVTLGA